MYQRNPTPCTAGFYHSVEYCSWRSLYNAIRDYCWGFIQSTNAANGRTPSCGSMGPQLGIHLQPLFLKVSIFKKMFYDVIESIVSNHQGGDYNEFDLEMMRILGMQSPASEESFKKTPFNDLVYEVYTGVQEHYNRKNEAIGARAYPQIKHVHETMSSKYSNIVLPLSDGRKETQIVVSLEEAYNSEGKSISKALERNIVLGMIDNEWKEHLREMDDLRTSVQQAVYEQKDPLLIYKLESFELFKTMMARLSAETIEFLVKADLRQEQEVTSTNREIAQNHYEKAQTQTNDTTSSTPPPRFQGSEGYEEAIRNSNQTREKQQPVVVEPKIGRNDSCPCGSGKKYKQCHGK